VIFIKADDVTKITKEAKYPDGPGQKYPDAPYPVYKETRSSRREPPKEFEYKRKGYFLHAQVEIGTVEFGLRVINGYKFGQFGYLGIGVGIDGIIIDLTGNSDYSGAYIPIFLHYSGDILKKQITPYYSVEAGYGFRPNPDINPASGLIGNSDIVGGHGGLMGDVGFGVKFYSRRKVYLSLSGHVNFQQSFTTIDNSYNSGYYGTYTYYTEHTILIIPNIRVGLGF
jgi:hypothetical protein